MKRPQTILLAVPLFLAALATLAAMRYFRPRPPGIILLTLERTSAEELRNMAELQALCEACREIRFPLDRGLDEKEAHLTLLGIKFSGEDEMKQPVDSLAARLGASISLSARFADSLNPVQTPSNGYWHGFRELHSFGIGGEDEMQAFFAWWKPHSRERSFLQLHLRPPQRAFSVLSEAEEAKAQQLEKKMRASSGLKSGVNTLLQLDRQRFREFAGPSGKTNEERGRADTIVAAFIRKLRDSGALENHHLIVAALHEQGALLVSAAAPLPQPEPKTLTEVPEWIVRLAIASSR